MNANIFDVQNDFQYILTCLGKEVSINGTSRLAIVSNSAVNRNFDDKIITTLTPIKRGDLIAHEENQYLIISEVNGIREHTTRYKAIMRKCNYDIKFNFQGFIKKFPAILSTKTSGIEEGKYVSLPYGTIQVTIQENLDSLGIALNQRFLKIGNPYKVTAIDRSAKGLITLTAQIDSFNANDDKTDEIADKAFYSWSIEITNGDSISINANDTLQLTSSLKLNSNVADNPGFVYSWSSNAPGVVTVDQNGLLRGIAGGNAVITLGLSAPDNDTMSDTISITVEAVIQDNFAITINGDTNINAGSTKTYTASVTNNGVVVTDHSVNWSVDDRNGNTTDKCHIQSYTGTECIVKNDNQGNARVIAVLDTDNTVIGYKEIVCKGLW